MRSCKKLFALLLIAALALSLFAGCNGSITSPSSQATSDGGTASSDSVELSEATSDGQPVTLRFSWWGSDSRHEATLEAINLYMEQNLHVTIDAEYGGFDGYQQKISTQLAGGTEPDLMQLDQPWLPAFTTQNPEFFADLRDYGDLIDVSSFSQTFLDDFCVFNGKLAGLPTGTNGLNFLVNSAILEAAGVEFGDVITWDDLHEQGVKVNAMDSESYMINMDSGISYYVVRIYLYQKTGMPLIDDETYTLNFTADDLKEAYELTERLYDDKVIIPLQESMLFRGSPQDNPKWESQSGGWFNWASTAELQSWGDNAKTLPYPQLTGGKDSGIIVRPSQVFSISSGSGALEEAVRFTNFFFNDEEAVKILKDCRSIPANSNARQILEDNGLVNAVSLEAVNLAMANPGVPESPLSTNSELTDSLTSCMEKLVYKQYDVDAAVAEAITLMEDVLANLQASQN